MKRNKSAKQQQLNIDPKQHKIYNEYKSNKNMIHARNNKYTMGKSVEKHPNAEKHTDNTLLLQAATNCIQHSFNKEK